MKPRMPGNLVGWLLALLVAGAALLLAAEPEQAALGLALVPFGWTRLVTVHLLATLPLGILLGVSLGRRTKAPLAAVGWIGLGLVAAAATVALGGCVGEELAQRQSAFTSRLVVRVLWCLALQVPWCALGTCLAGPVPAGRWHALGLAGLVAVVLPAAFERTLIEEQSRKAGDLLQRLRLARAHAIVRGLCDLGSDQPLLGKSPAAWGRELADLLQGHRAALERPLEPAAPASVRLNRARMLAVLGRLGEAAECLAPLPDTDAEAVLLRAAVLQDQQRWDESSAAYRRALGLLADAGPAASPGRIRAYDGLAFNARGRKAYADAEAVYAEALQREPEAQAHFHFQLGRHYQQGGRMGKALAHLRTAAQLDPAGYGERVHPLVEEIRLHTPGCLLSGP